MVIEPNLLNIYIADIDFHFFNRGDKPGAIDNLQKPGKVVAVWTNGESFSKHTRDTYIYKFSTADSQIE